jgi:hypothetical protein
MLESRREGRGGTFQNLHARHRAEREFGAIMGMLERRGRTVARALSAATGLSYGAGRGRT